MPFPRLRRISVVGASACILAGAARYDVTYCSNLDIERDPDLLKRCRVFLSVGHDEYWTRGMYENVSTARNRGVSLAFLSGNSVCHVIEPYASTSAGKPLRAFARKVRFEDEDRLMGVKRMVQAMAITSCSRPNIGSLRAQA